MFNKMNNNMEMDNIMHGGYMDKGPYGCCKPIVKEYCCCRPRKICYTVCDCCYTKKFTKKMPDNMCCTDMNNKYYSDNMNEMYDNSWGSGRGYKDNYMGENAEMYGDNDMDNCWG